MSYRGTVLATPNLTGYWRLEEQTGNAQDETSNNRDLTHSNAPTLGVAGLVPSQPLDLAALFNGTDEYASRNVAADFQGASAISVELTIRPDTLGNRAPIANRGSSTDKGWWINVGTVGDVGFWGSADGSAQSGAVAPSGTLVAGTTYHIIGTYDGVDLRIYVNGVLRDTTALAGPLHTTTTAGAFAFARLGAQSADYFHGVLDEVAVFKSVLNQATIDEHYAAWRQRPPEIARLTVDIYEADGTTYVGGISKVLSANIHEAVNEIGSFSFTTPATDPASERATQGREIRINREGEGTIFRGKINLKELQIAESGQHVWQVSGHSLAIELEWQNTYQGHLIDDDSITDAMTGVLSGSGWTPLISGSGYLNDSDRIDNKSLWSAAVHLADRQDAIVRETRVERQLEIKRGAATDTGIRLTAPESIAPELAENTLIGLLSDIRMREDSRNLFNRIVPYGEESGNVVLNLNGADRSSPYAISSFYKASPSITSIISATVNLDSENSVDIGTVRATGRNRVGVGFLSSTTGVVTVFFGVRMRVAGFLIGQDGESAGTIISNEQTNVYIFNNLPEGDLQVSLDRCHVDVDGEPCRIVFMTFQDAQLPYVLQAGVKAAAATGTSAAPSISSTAIGGTEAGALVVGACHTVASRTFTSPGDQTRQVTFVDTVVDTKVLTSGTAAMSWTLNTSNGWAVLIVVVKLAKTYYIEDAASVTAYGRRVKMLLEPNAKFVGGDDAKLVAAASTLYDYANAFMARHKDPVTTYSIGVASLPSIRWLVGDTIKLDFRGVVFDEDGERFVWHDVNDDFYIMEREESFDEDGMRKWGLVISSHLRPQPDDASIFAKAIERIMALESQ